MLFSYFDNILTLILICRRMWTFGRKPYRRSPGKVTVCVGGGNLILVKIITKSEQVQNLRIDFVWMDMI